MQLIETLEKIVSNKVGSCLQARSDSEVRIVLRGLPLDILDALHGVYSSNGGVRVPDHDPIRVLLVSDDVQGDKAAFCGKCTVEDAVNSRNVLQTILVLLPMDKHLNMSIQSSVSFIGLDPQAIGEKQRFVEDAFVEDLFEQLRKQLNLGSEEWSKARRVIDFAFGDREKRGEADRSTTSIRECWRLLSELFDVNGEQNLFLARCGLPNINNGEIGSSEHLDILIDLAKFIEANGFGAAMDTLLGEAEEKLHSPIRAFFDSLFAKNCESPPDFITSPSYYYSQEGDPLPWWTVLDLDTWLTLLQSTKQQKKGGLHPDCCNTITSHRVNGLPFIVQNIPQFRVKVDGSSVPERISVFRGQGRNLTEEGSISVGEVWTPAEVPVHGNSVNYRFLAGDDYKPTDRRVISLENYEPGIIVSCLSAKRITPPKKRKLQKKHDTVVWECDVELAATGTFQVELLLSSSTTIANEAISENSTSENIEQRAAISEPGSLRRIFFAETDEESTYRINVEDSLVGGFEFHIHFHSEGEEPTGVASVFEALVMDNLQGKSGASSVEIPWGHRIYDLERWLLEDPHACYPLILSGDYLSSLSSRPNWRNRPIMSEYSCENDVRPDFDDWKVPNEFIQVRNELLCYLREKMPDNERLIELFRFDMHMREASFQNLVSRYLGVYEQWLNEDYESAILSDAYLVIPPERGSRGLSSNPEAILMTPLHPVRFAWHCLAHTVLAETAYEGISCPAAGIINPNTVPDMVQIPCLQPGGRVDRIPFMAIRSSSAYWGVLWNGRNLADLNDASRSGLWGGDWGITIGGASNGFNKAQVKRAICDVRDIRTAKNTIAVAITSDTQGSSSCNDGIIEWCEENLGDVERDEWALAGARRLDVIDLRHDERLTPSSAVIADITIKTNAAVRWFRPQGAVPSDLCIIENLGQHHPGMTEGEIRSPMGWGALTRSRIRRHIEASQGSAFIQESRVGKYYLGPEDENDLAYRIGKTVTFMESSRAEGADVCDSYVFTPCLDTIISSLDQSAYCALSSSVIDSSCFFGRHRDTYLWDYDLPNYSNVSGESNGFYLLVRENPTLVSSIRRAIDELDISTDLNLSDETIHNVLIEIARRGMPTLKRISDGGSAAIGEFGVFVALRLLQDSFVKGERRGCILPTKQRSDDGTSTVNLVIPVDPFQSQLDSLRRASERSGASFKRPDLIVFSIALDNTDNPISVKITPVEVKARTAELYVTDMQAAIGQAKSFSDYFDKHLCSHRHELGRLWDLAIKDFITSMVTFGFRVYGLLDEFNNDSKEWSILHEKVVGGLFADMLHIEFDSIGRLFVVDKSTQSRAMDADGDGFNEVIVITAKDALDVFKNISGTIIPNICNQVGDWRLHPTEESTRIPDGAIPLNAKAQATDNTPAPAPLPEDENLNKDVVNDVSAGDIDEGIKFDVGNTIHGFTEVAREFWPSNTNLNQLNMGIIGDLGTGKTQLTKTLIYQMVAHPEKNRGHKPRFLIFDYKDDYSSKEFVEAVGAKVVDPVGLPLNMFDVRNCTGRKPRVERNMFFADVLSKIYSGIGPVQKLNLRNAVMQAYEKSAANGFSAPVLDQVYKEYSEVTDGRPDSPTQILTNLIDLEIFEADPEKVISFDEFLDGVVVINLKALGQDDDSKNLLVVIFLNFFYEYMLKLEKKPFVGQTPQLRFINSMLLVDEADSIMKYEFDVLHKILLQGREFGVGVLLASQYLSHFKRGETNYLQPLLTWFIHKVPNITVKELESIGLTRASNEVVNQIRSLRKHECLFKTLDVNGDFIRGLPFYKLLVDD